MRAEEAEITESINAEAAGTTETVLSGTSTVTVSESAVPREAR